MPTQEAKQEGLGCGCPMWSNPFTGKRENNHNQLCREKWALKLNDQLYRDMTTADRFDALYAVLVEFLAAHDRETNIPALLESHAQLVEALQTLSDEFNSFGICEEGTCRHAMCTMKWKAINRAVEALAKAKEISEA